MNAHVSPPVAGHPIWHAAFTAPRAEFTAENSLRRLGYRVVVPWALHEVRHARTVSEVKRPVFPRYAFFERPPGKGVPDRRTTPGITDLVRIGIHIIALDWQRVLAPIFDECTETGWMPAQDGLRPLSARLDQAFEVGQSIRTPLDGLIYQIAALDGRGYAEVWGKMFGTRRLMKVALDRVEAA